MLRWHMYLEANHKFYTRDPLSMITRDKATRRRNQYKARLTVSVSGNWFQYFEKVRTSELG